MSDLTVEEIASPPTVAQLRGDDGDIDPDEGDGGFYDKALDAHDQRMGRV